MSEARKPFRAAPSGGAVVDADGKVAAFVPSRAGPEACRKMAAAEEMASALALAVMAVKERWTGTMRDAAILQGLAALGKAGVELPEG